MQITDLSLSPNDAKTIDCPFCGGTAERVMSGFAFPGSRKSWAGRNEVNFHVDTADEVYKKQLRLQANKGQPKGMFLTTKQWNNVLSQHKRRADNTKPIKVADEHKYSINKPGKTYVGAEQ